MRMLSSIEITSISAGTSCLDSVAVHNIQDKAFKDGIIFSALIVPLAMAVTFGLSSDILITATAGIILAPYAAATGYFHSSSWNIIS